MLKIIRIIGFGNGANFCFSTTPGKIQHGVRPSQKASRGPSVQNLAARGKSQSTRRGRDSEVSRADRGRGRPPLAFQDHKEHQTELSREMFCVLLRYVHREGVLHVEILSYRRQTHLRVRPRKGVLETNEIWLAVDAMTQNQPARSKDLLAAAVATKQHGNIEQRKRSIIRNECK